MFQTIAQHRTPTSYQARNILEAVFNEYYEEDIPAEEFEGVEKFTDLQFTILTDPSVINVYPNPSTGWVMINYVLNESSENVHLIITDLAGKELVRIAFPRRSVFALRP